MLIKILGSGCTKCAKLEENVQEALEQLNIQTEVVKVKDLSKIMEYSIMTTPGLVIDEKVVSSGRLLSVEELKNILV